MIRLSLHARLVLLVILAALPGLGLIFYSGIEQRSNALLLYRHEVMGLAEQTARYQEKLIEKTQQTLLVLSQMPQFERLDADACSVTLANLLAKSKGHHAFAACDSKGKMFASAPLIDAEVDFSGDRWFQRVVETGGFTICGKIGRFSGKPSMILAYPVFSEQGELRSIISTGMDVSWISEFLVQNRNLPPTTSFYVLDREFRVLGSYPNPSESIGQPIPEKDIVKTLSAQTHGVVEATGSDGIERIYGFTTIGPASDPIYLNIGIPRGIILEDANRQLFRNLILLGAVTLLSLLAARFFARPFILRQVNGLVDITMRVAEGDLQARSGTPYPKGELGQLARAFDTMTQSLQNREAERQRAEETLRESEESYRSLFENILEGFAFCKMIFDEDNRPLDYVYLSVNKAFEKLTGLEDAVGKRATSLIPGIRSSHPELFEIYGRVALTGKPERFEIYLEDLNAWLLMSAYSTMKGYFVTVFDNITERKRTEEILRASEEQFRTLVKNAPDAIFIQTDGLLAYVNEAAAKLYGASSEEELLGRPNLDLIHPQSRAAVEERIRLINEEKKAVPAIEQKHLKLDGTVIDVEVNSAPINFRKSAGVLVFVRDITFRKRAEEALKESRQQLANIIDFLPDATFVIDQEGRVIAWNKAIEEMTGIKARDMLGKGDYEYGIPFYKKRRPILVDLALSSQEEIEAAGYTRIVRRDSVVLAESCVPGFKEQGQQYLFVTAGVLRDSNGRIVGAIESIRDVTERRLMEEALAQAEKKYRSIFENAMEGIFQVSPERRFISANPALAHCLGYDSPEELLSSVTDVSRQLYVNPEDEAELLRKVNEQGAIPKFEARFYRKDGSIAWISMNLRPIRAESGKLLHWEGSLRDITERKLALQEKAALESRLNQAQKLEAIGTLAGGIAHDFNNVLGIIMGYSELASLGLPEGSRKAKIGEVLKACQRAKDLIRQILSFSRPDEGIERRPCDIRPIIRELAKFFRASLPTTIEIHQDISSQSGMISGNPTQVHQILTNLCTNAAQAMEEKGGVLEVSLTDMEIDQTAIPPFSALKPGPCLRLSVSDTGCGMEPATLQRIFDPYFTTKAIGKGSGLGLAVVHGIVKSHGGAITVYSEPGKGTTFNVFFPRIELAPAEPGELGAHVSGGAERILFVDDEPKLIKIWKEALEQLQYKLVTCTDSLEALELFRAHPEDFDLVLTDYTMPHMTGNQLAREMMRIRPDIPIILCTGLRENITEEKIRETGIRAYLMKPLSISETTKAIRKVLDGESHKAKA